MFPIERVAGVFVEAADTLVDEFDLIDFLHDLTTWAKDLCSASAVGLFLASHDETLHDVAASSERARDLELFQLEVSEGPCIDCFRSGKPVVVSDLSEAAHRWPEFAPRAAEGGVRSVHAMPMRLRDKVIGTLNIYVAEPMPLQGDDIKVVQALADIATIAILQERAIADADALNEQLQEALNSRIVIEQAKGMISRSRAIGVEGAFEVLRSHARSRSMRVADVAHAVVDGRIEVPSSEDP